MLVCWICTHVQRITLLMVSKPFDTVPPRNCVHGFKELFNNRIKIPSLRPITIMAPMFKKVSIMFFPISTCFILVNY
uniref:Uncharacterized protein n=1 Tax=Arundo donax TaxID=35708 RepID=A0A0A9FR72_ARUDO